MNLCRHPEQCGRCEPVVQPVHLHLLYEQQLYRQQPGYCLLHPAWHGLPLCSVPVQPECHLLWCQGNSQVLFDWTTPLHCSSTASVEIWRRICSTVAQFFQASLASAGTVQKSLMREYWVVYVSLTGTNGPDRKETWYVRRAVQLRGGGRTLFLSRQWIHTVPPHGVTSQRQEKQPDSQGKKPVGEGGR